MLKPEDRLHRETQRKRLREYLAGHEDGPLVIERSDAYPLDQVLFPSLFAHLRHMTRYVVLCLARYAPFCFLKAPLYRTLGMKVGKSVCFAPGAILDPLFPELIELGDDCCLGMNCALLTHEYTAQNFRAGRTRMGSGSVIGAGAIVRAGVTIGRKVTVGANSFVNRDVPDGETVGGVPARLLKRS